MRELLLGAFIGTCLASLAFPIIYFFGESKLTITLLLYFFPAIGVACSLALGSFRNTAQTVMKSKRVLLVSSDNCVYEGEVVRNEKNLLVLENVVRKDLSEPVRIARLLISKDRIAKLEFLV